MPERSEVRALLASVLLASACVTAPRPTPVDAPLPEPVLTRGEALQLELHRAVERFVTATEGRQFDALHALLSQRLRDRYTPQLLARDFDAEPYAHERLARIKARAAEPLTLQGDTASLEWAPGRSLKLTRESDSWKIASLE